VRREEGFYLILRRAAVHGLPRDGQLDGRERLALVFERRGDGPLEESVDVEQVARRLRRAELPVERD
jgi:hypothetical protein